jgi:hypothetical protein
MCIYQVFERSLNNIELVKYLELSIVAAKLAEK